MDRRLLKMTLTSGSSKVFNCLDITRQLQAAQEEGPPPLFSVRALNYGVFFKEAANDSLGRTGEVAIDTLLYFPYDADDLMGGGASVSLNDRRFEAVVREFTQIFGTEEHADAFADRSILDVLRESPSLDPFLLKSSFAKHGIPVPRAYLRITDEEWNEIRDHVRRKVLPMIEFGTQQPARQPSAAALRKLDDFVDRIWDGSDVTSLHPLLSALQIPLSEAAEVTFAWKGVVFFEFRYERKTRAIMTFASWLKEHCEPAEFVKSAYRTELERRREQIKLDLKRHWSMVLQILAEARASYETLFVRRAGARDFQRFLSQARRHYVTLGRSFNIIDHALEIFERTMQGDPRRRLRSDELEDFLSITMSVLR